MTGTSTQREQGDSAPKAAWQAPQVEPGVRAEAASRCMTLLAAMRGTVIPQQVQLRPLRRSMEQRPPDG